jgi:hypothetical protein
MMRFGGPASLVKGDARNRLRADDVNGKGNGLHNHLTSPQKPFKRVLIKRHIPALTKAEITELGGNAAKAREPKPEGDASAVRRKSPWEERIHTRWAVPEALAGITALQ